jgi:hypothetical protein
MLADLDRADDSAGIDRPLEELGIDEGMPSLEAALVEEAKDPGPVDDDS